MLKIKGGFTEMIIIIMSGGGKIDKKWLEILQRLNSILQKTM